MDTDHHQAAADSNATVLTIQHQITRGGTGLLCALLLLHFVALSAFSLHKIKRMMDEDAAVLAGLVAQHSAEASFVGNATDAQNVLDGLKTRPQVVRAFIRTEGGHTLAQMGRPAADGQCADSEQETTALHDWRCGVLAVAPIQFMDKRVGTVSVRVSVQPTLTEVSIFSFASIVLSLALALVSIAAWRRLARRISQPLTELIAESERVTRNAQAAINVPKGGPLEIMVLGNALKRMLAELAARDLALRDELRRRQLVEEELSVLAYTDSVTALHNRHYFLKVLEDILQQAPTGAGRFALLYIDLDGFKSVNDTFGHPAGDRLLREVGKRLRDHLRDTDVLCRLGGDEFGVLIRPLHRADDAGLVAQQLVEQVALPFNFEDQTTLRVTASVGVAVYPDDAKDSVSLVGEADQALARAKLAGKARCCRAGHTKEQAREQQLMHDLPSARSRGELFVLYQPKVRVISLEGVIRVRTVAVEALLRWKHPGLGLIGPGEFIGMAESSGHIVEIGKWVLETACEQLTLWRSTLGLDLHLSVNLSPCQLMNAAAIDELIAVLGASGLPANAVALELTESAFVDRSDDMIGRLTKLRRAGFGLSVDDFGTGYSSLAYIASFPVTMLKLDRSFIKDVADNSRSHAIARAIVMLAQALDLEVVAEGVETVEQSACLARMDANMLHQGYLFARPMDGEALREWLAVAQKNQHVQPEPSLHAIAAWAD